MYLNRWELALLEGAAVSLKHIRHKQMHVSFVQALIKSSSRPFMWVLLLGPEWKQPWLLYPRPHRVLAAWARGRCPCIHVSARDRDRSHRQGWKAPPSHKRSRLSSVGCRETASEMQQKGRDCLFWAAFCLSRVLSSPDFLHFRHRLNWKWLHLMKADQSAPWSCMFFFNIILSLSRSISLWFLTVCLPSLKLCLKEFWFPSKTQTSWLMKPSSIWFLQQTCVCVCVFWMLSGQIIPLVSHMALNLSPITEVWK